MTYKSAVKQVLGELPFAPEVYWQLRQSGKPVNRSFSLRKAEKHLPEWRHAVETSLKGSGLHHQFRGTDRKSVV